MSNFVWFRLIVRAIGVLLIGLGLPQVISTIWWTIAALRQQDPIVQALVQTEYLLYMLANVVASAVQLGFGIYLLFGGGWIIRYCLHDLRGRCIACGYNTSGINAGFCPECGIPIGPAPTPAPTPESPTPPAP